MKEYLDFFINCPEQTEVVVQVYLLNPIFNFITYLVNLLLDSVRFILKLIMPRDNK